MLGLYFIMTVCVRNAYIKKQDVLIMVIRYTFYSKSILLCSLIASDKKRECDINERLSYYITLSPDNILYNLYKKCNIIQIFSHKTNVRLII